jgi:two-component system phosphate regulon response regulator PhoB
MEPEAPRIYLVEDEPQQREVLALLLEGEGYAVTSVGSAEEAWKNIQKNLRPSLVVTDVKLTGEDGITFFQRVRSHKDHASTPFIFITGYNDPGAMKRLQSLPNVSYVTKPYNVEDFMALVHTILPLVG